MLYHWAIAFSAMFALDFVWTFYTKYVVQKKALLAAAYAGGLVLCNAVVTISYIDDHWLLIPVILGALAGTGIGVRLHS